MVLGEGREAIDGDRSAVKHMRAAKVHHGGHDEAVFRAKFSVGRVKSQEGPYLRT